jgi:hypothetical protein
MRSPASSAKKRQRGLSVLDRQAEEQRIQEDKEDARRHRSAQQQRSQSVPPAAEAERGRGRKRMNEAGRGTRKDGGADVMQLQRRSTSQPLAHGEERLQAERSVVVNGLAPAGGAVISGCPARTDATFEQGTAAGDVAHAQAVRAGRAVRVCG